MTRSLCFSPRAALLCGSLALSGCFPIPHDVTIHPAVSGTLSVDGVAAGDRELRYAYGSECSEEVAGRTDAAGAYALEAWVQHEEYIFFGDTFYPTHLCVQLPAGDGVWRLPAEPLHQTVLCRGATCVADP